MKVVTRGVFTVVCHVTLFSAASSSSACFDRTGSAYSLAWSAQGASFFEDWIYGTHDFTGGAVNYVNSSTARRDNLTQAFPDYAIVRPGSSLYLAHC